MMDDLEALVEGWLKQYGRVEYFSWGEQEFAWRPLTRAEYKHLLMAELPPAELEELICQTCTLYPVDYDFSNCEVAGIPTSLAREILEKSGFSVDGKPSELAQEWLANFRQEMQLAENQIDCVIVAAFPQFTLEEVADWTVEKALYYYSRAEWILRHLRGGRRVGV